MDWVLSGGLTEGVKACWRTQIRKQRLLPGLRKCCSRPETLIMDKDKRSCRLETLFPVESGLELETNLSR